MTTHAYFPGCSLRGTGRAYDESLVQVFRVLGVAIEELEDWNCCGATTYMSYDEIQSYALAARNLAIARRKNQDIMAPCAACYLVLNKTQHYVAEYPEVRKIVEKALDAIGLTYPEGVRVRHPLDILLNDVGLDAIKAKVVRPLKGLRVAPYYGERMHHHAFTQDAVFGYYRIGVNFAALTDLRPLLDHRGGMDLCSHRGHFRVRRATARSGSKSICGSFNRS